MAKSVAARGNTVAPRDLRAVFVSIFSCSSMHVSSSSDIKDPVAPNTCFQFNPQISPSDHDVVTLSRRRLVFVYSPTEFPGSDEWCICSLVADPFLLSFGRRDPGDLRPFMHCQRTYGVRMIFLFAALTVDITAILTTGIGARARAQGEHICC